MAAQRSPQYPDIPTLTGSVIRTAKSRSGMRSGRSRALRLTSWTRCTGGNRQGAGRPAIKTNWANAAADAGGMPPSGVRQSSLRLRWSAGRRWRGPPAPKGQLIRDAVAAKRRSLPRWSPGHGPHRPSLTATTRLALTASSRRQRGRSWSLAATGRSPAACRARHWPRHMPDKIQKNHRKTSRLIRDLHGARSVGVISGQKRLRSPDRAACGCGRAITPSTNRRDAGPT